MPLGFAEELPLRYKMLIWERLSLGINGPVNRAKMHMDLVNMLQSIQHFLLDYTQNSRNKGEPLKMQQMFPYEIETFCPDVFKEENIRDSIEERSGGNKVVKDILSTVASVNRKGVKQNAGSSSSAVFGK